VNIGSYSPKSEVVLNSLRFLQYCPGGIEELGLLMANLHAPGLSDLHISLEEGDGLPIALKCGGLFRTAIRMRIVSGHQTIAHVRTLYAMTSSVSSLDCYQLLMAERLTYQYSS
jgi:hypothetical protein